MLELSDLFLKKSFEVGLFIEENFQEYIIKNSPQGDLLFPRKINFRVKKDLLGSAFLFGQKVYDIYSWFNSKDSFALYVIFSNEQQTNIDTIFESLGLPTIMTEGTNVNNAGYEIRSWDKGGYEIFFSTTKNSFINPERLFIITIGNVSQENLFEFTHSW